jgi:hypothetical protein
VLNIQILTGAKGTKLSEAISKRSNQTDITGCFSRRNPFEAQPARVDLKVTEKTVDQIYFVYGFVITRPVMAFTEVSPTHKDAISPIDKSIHQENGIYPAGAHHPDHPDMVGVLKPGHPSRIRRCIATPMAKEAKNLWFIDISCHSTRSLH